MATGRPRLGRRAQGSRVVVADFAGSPESALTDAGGTFETSAASRLAGLAPSKSLWTMSEIPIEADIPKRDWIAHKFYLRKAVTGIVGQAGISKSSLMLVHAIALATGKEYGGLRPKSCFKVLVYGTEDDQDEQARRISAIIRRLGCERRDLQKRLLIAGPTGAGTLLVRNERNKLEPTEALTELRGLSATFRPDVVMLDPFVELHSEEENGNTEVKAVVAYLRQLAAEFECAFCIAHHTRKGPQEAGDIDMARGASSFVGAVRLLLTIVGMSEDEEQAFGLTPGQRKHFFRVDGGKSNYAALAAAEWFERTELTLDNGDGVAVPVPWTPPSDAVSLEAKLAIEAALERGCNGEPWSPTLSDKPRSVKALLAQNGLMTKAGQQAFLTTLTAAGYQFLTFKHPIQRRPAMGIRTPDGRPNAAWIEQEGLDP